MTRFSTVFVGDMPYNIVQMPTWKAAAICEQAVRLTVEDACQAADATPGSIIIQANDAYLILLPNGTYLRNDE